MWYIANYWVEKVKFVNICLHAVVLCVFICSARRRSWLAMEWCWLQTGWQRLQGDRDILKQQRFSSPYSDWQWQLACTPFPPSLFRHPPLPPPPPYPSPPSHIFSSQLFLSAFSCYESQTLFFLIFSLLELRLILIVLVTLTESSMSWLSRLNPRGPGSRSGRSAAPSSPCTADPETCLMVFENHWRQVSWRHTFLLNSDEITYFVAVKT